MDGSPVPVEDKTPDPDLSIWQRIANTFFPKHRQARVSTSSVRECLRKLEKKVGLPKCDLSIKGVPKEMVGVPAMVKTSVYTICSRANEQRKNFSVYASLRVVKEGRFSGLVIGEINVSECSGHFKNSICTECGYESKLYN